jgi:hypothetical protein
MITRDLYRLVALALSLALLMSANSTAYAQEPPGPWASGISCVNLSTVDASIALSFYQQGSGSPSHTFNDTILANSSKNYFSPNISGLASGFRGSAVIQSDQPVSCNVNTQKQSTGTQTDPYRIGTSAGVATTDTAPTVYVPQVLKNLSGFSSYVAVQNTDAATTAVTVTYKDRNGNSIPAATETINIPAQSTHIFYQSANTNLTNGFLGAATISAVNGTSKLAAIVAIYNDGASFDRSQLLSYNGFVSGGNKLFVPRFVRNYYGYNGGLTIQNIGTGPAQIKVTFNFAGNSYTYTSATPIASGAALALYAPNIAELSGVDSLPVNQRFGSAVIETISGGPIVAIVNEDNRGGPGIPAERAGQGSTYNAIPDGSQTNTIFLPQVPRNAGGIFSGGFQISNTTGTAGTCNISYAGVPAANETNVPLPANGSMGRYAPNVPNLPNGFNAAVTVQCTVPVVGIANLAVNPGSGRFGDSFTQSNGINR